MSLRIGGGLAANLSARVEQPKPRVAQAGAGGSIGHSAADSFTAGGPYLGLEPSRALSLARQLGESLWSVAQPAIDWAQAKAQEVLEQEAVRDRLEALDPQRQIEQLGPGDSYKVGFELGGSIEAAKGGIKADSEVKCRVKTNPDGTPVLGPDGQPRLEYVVTTGGGLNGGVGSGSKSGTVGVDARTELVVDTPEEAQRAMQLMSRIRGGNPTPGGVDPEHFTAEELQFIREHTTAIELSGNAAVQVAKALGVKLDESVNLSGGGGGGGSGALSLRLEVGPDGRFSSATVKQQVQVDVDVATPSTDGGVGNTGNKGTASVTVEDKFTFPSSVTPGDLLDDPSGTISRLGESRRESTLTVKVAGNRGARGGEVELKLSGKPDEIMNPRLLERAREGDLPGALREAGQNTQVELNVTTQQRRGLNVGLNIEVFEGRAVAERTDSEVVLNRKGTANDVADALADAARLAPEAPLMSSEVRGRRLVAGLNGA